MNSNLLMNCLWYEDISPDNLANALEMVPDRLFKKIFDKVDGVVHFAPCWDDNEDWVTDDEDEINEVFYK